MRDIEIRPTISVWDADRWQRVDSGSKLLDLLHILSGELPRAEAHARHAGNRVDPATAERRQFDDLVRRVERERDSGAERLSTATAAEARGFISTFRRVFEGVLP